MILAHSIGVPFAQLVILLAVTLILSYCGVDVEDSNSPAPPQWIQKSFPEEWPESGIDAHESGGIYLEWHPNPEPDIVAYTIYRAFINSLNDSLEAYVEISHINLSSDSRLEFIDELVEPMIMYSYVIQAVDQANNKSNLSEPIRYEKLPATWAESMIPNGNHSLLPQDRQLQWGMGGVMEMEDYCITLLTSAGEFVFREVFMPGEFIGWNDQWAIPNSVNLQPGEIYKWRLDTGAQYINGLETSGSESTWATFLIEDG